MKSPRVPAVKNNRLRSRDMKTAIVDTKADMRAGRYVVESPEEHVRRVSNRTKRPAQKRR